MLDTDTTWGLGFVVDPRRFGEPCSTAVFGHPGLQSVTAFADPAHDLVVAFAANGLPEIHVDFARQRMIVNAIYDELALATEAPRAAFRRRRRVKQPRVEPLEPLPELAPTEFLSDAWFENVSLLASTWPPMTGASAEVQFVVAHANGDQTTIAAAIRRGELVGIRRGEARRPALTITMSEDTARDVLTGSIDRNAAIAQGEVQFEGSVRKAIRLAPLRASVHYKRTMRHLGRATVFPQADGISHPAPSIAEV
jgi:hypothetical protein